MNDRCSYCRQPRHRATPRVIQAIPMPSVHEATHRASCLPSVIVGAIVLGIAFLEGIVPGLVGMVR